MKLPTASQIRELDNYTITHEPVKSIDLMERAASVFTQWFTSRFSPQQAPVAIFCGPGNNGGDGLATARMLHQQGYEVAVVQCVLSDNTSEDYRINLNRLPRFHAVAVHELKEGDLFPALPDQLIIIDAILGSGLNRPVEGYWAEVFEHINQHPGIKVSIDIPSGTFADTPTRGHSIEADYTFSFEFPKRAFFFVENDHRVGDWSFEPIQLHPAAIADLESDTFYADESLVRPLIRRRPRHGHKGTFGHALLICGSYGMLGAAILSARACLRAGTGLLSVHLPKAGYEVMQIGLPEAMVSCDRHQYCFSEVPELTKFSAVGIGCGLGQSETTVETLLELLEQQPTQPLVLDADALNILAHHPEALLKVPKGSILTPHPGEFDRLFGAAVDSFTRFSTLRQKAAELELYILLKGAYSTLAAPNGEVWFNSTGNPGMATGGSGDVLTGILAGLLAQGYPPRDAALLGTYVHGLAGDLAAEALGHESLLASDIIDHLGKAFHYLKP